MKIDSIRKEYALRSLSERDIIHDPILFFGRWFEEAIKAEVTEPNAMTLATASASGAPSARMVLLKGFDHDGFVFYTNLESRKGAELQSNPRAALLFWWAELERQIRIEGDVQPVAEQEALSYFQSRPRDSQLGAWASPQSKRIPDRSFVASQMEQISTRFQSMDVLPLPPNWGGYRIAPKVFEFWQGRESRLHDRIRFDAENNQWRISRLAP
jgi:pyridoxamine 5'-phosphate oxidase